MPTIPVRLLDLGDDELGCIVNSIEALEQDTPEPEVRMVEKSASPATPAADPAADESVLEDLVSAREPEAAGSEKPSTELPDAPQGHDEGMIDDLLGGDSSEDRGS